MMRQLPPLIAATLAGVVIALLVLRPPAGPDAADPGATPDAGSAADPGRAPAADGATLAPRTGYRSMPVPIDRPLAWLPAPEDRVDLVATYLVAAPADGARDDGTRDAGARAQHLEARVVVAGARVLGGPRTPPPADDGAPQPAELPLELSELETLVLTQLRQQGAVYRALLRPASEADADSAAPMGLASLPRRLAQAAAAPAALAHRPRRYALGGDEVPAGELVDLVASLGGERLRIYRDAPTRLPAGGRTTVELPLDTCLTVALLERLGGIDIAPRAPDAPPLDLEHLRRLLDDADAARRAEDE